VRDDFHHVHAARIAHDLGDVHDVHDVHDAHDAHDAHFRNDNGVLERSNVGVACNNILGCNTSIGACFCEKSNHSRVQFAHKRNRLKEN
jgi:hypothetical protein